MSTQARRRPLSWEKQVRNNIRDSARPAATRAAGQVKVERHRTRGLHPAEVFLGALAIRWLARR